VHKCNSGSDFLVLIFADVLTKLYIRNYAIIEEIEISFGDGLTIITGETGAGKSILMGALSLILGERADFKMLLNTSEKTIIEGVFRVQHLSSVTNFLQLQDIDPGDELIIRREISGNSKSRVFINDTPSTLHTLAALSTLLIDLHRQFDTHELLHAAQQLQLIDEVAQTHTLLKTFQQQYRQWKKIQQEFDDVTARNKQMKMELDYHQFLFNELEEFNPQAGELEGLEMELERLNHSESVKTSLQKVLYQLRDSDDPMLAQLKSILQLLESHRQYLPQLESINTRLQDTMIELKEIGSELTGLFDQTYYDEERIQFLNDRIQEGNRLLKKHGVLTDDALFTIKIELEEKISHALSADELELELKKSLLEAFKKLSILADELSKERATAIPVIETHVNELLKKVGMPNATLRIQREKTDIHEAGFDKVDIQIDANKTGQFGPITKVASGGELSRLMLCIKSLLAHASSLPTLVFDEIDTGISGETAVQVGQIMKELAQQHQLICITHLPQIAGKAAQHLYMYKEENKEGQIRTYMKVLSLDERIEVLAEMLSGKDASSEAREMVRQLMK
jgi:DNA repair protein RecN (Recombination protein N)